MTIFAMYKMAKIFVVCLFISILTSGNCQPFNCNPLGSKSLIKENGSCLCLGYVTSLQCNSCKSEQQNFPNCSPNGYPTKMKLSISGEAQKYQASFGGTYFLQENKTNNEPYLIHQSGQYAIWWINGINFWAVGNFLDLGSTRAAIIGPFNNDSPPNQITNGWKYAKSGSLRNTNGVHFEDWTFKQVLSPPTKLELTLAGKAKEERWTSPGTYILGNSLVNGYPYWLKADESQAIWFSKAASSWSVDRKENLGTNVGGIQGPKGKDSYPN